MIDIAVCDKDESVYLIYRADVVPRKGELIHFPHKGSFRILDVAYRVSDDAGKFPQEELLMYAELIIDLSTPVQGLGYENS